MLKNNKDQVFIQFLLLFFLLFIGCSTKPTDNEEKVYNPNPKERAKEWADKGGGIFNLGKDKKNETNFEFGTSNVLWRATLKNLEFLPLLNADYSGGVIIYDWYNEKNTPTEYVKITIRFLSNDLRSDSIQVITHKKICDTSDKCFISKSDNNLSGDIKSSILNTARLIKIEEEKVKNNK
jgi:hypothetical protein